MGNYDTAEDSRRKLPTLANEIAAEMGEGWHAEVAEHVVYVRHTDTDEAFHLGVPWNKPTMVQVSGSYPDGVRDVYGVEHHSISVSAGRGARVFAAEIRRRLLPDYLATLTVVQAGIARNNERQDEQRQVADEIARRFPSLWRSKDGFDFSDGSSRGVDGLSFRLSVREGGSVHIDRVYGSGEQIMAVVAALAGA